MHFKHSLIFGLTTENTFSDNLNQIISECADQICTVVARYFGLCFYVYFSSCFKPFPGTPSTGWAQMENGVCVWGGGGVVFCLYYISF